MHGRSWGSVCAVIARFETRRFAMTISGIRRMSAATACVLVLGPSVAAGQVMMPFPKIGGVATSSPQFGQLQVRPMQVRPIQQSPGFATSPRRDISHHQGSGVSHASSGSSIHASVSGDHFSVDLHVGSDLGLRGVPSVHVGDHAPLGGHQQVLHNGHLVSVFRSGTGLGYYRYGFGYSYQNSYYPYVDGSYYSTPGTSVQPQLPPPSAGPPEQVEPPTAEDIAAYELRYGDADDAVDLYRKILRDEPQDAVSMRRLAVALLKDRRFEEGVAMMAMAYRTDALLSDETLSGYLFDDEKELRRLLQKCVIHANRTKLASAWLTVVVMMQAEDRDDRALKMVDRASEAGLDRVVVDSLRRALGG